MFNKKSQLQILSLDERISKAESVLNGHNEHFWNELGYSQKCVPGLKSQVLILTEENQKLKAIVAELVDYVYREKK